MRLEEAECKPAPSSWPSSVAVIEIPRTNFSGYQFDVAPLRFTRFCVIWRPLVTKVFEMTEKKMHGNCSGPTERLVV